MTERRAQSARKGPEWSRGVAWFGMLILVCAASGWALLWVDCALTGGGWDRPEGLRLLYELAVGLAPLVVVLGAVVALWKTQGPPFSPPRDKR
jgi:hypothetical protein